MVRFKCSGASSTAVMVTMAAGGAQCSRHARSGMLCPARCSCFLCRELQSCRAADARKPPNKNMCDNFILKKAEAWEPMKFIRGAARLSVRHWQSREPLTPPKTRLATHKSTSCEQLYPHTTEEVTGPFGMRKAPSTDRVKPQSESKPLFKLLGNSRLKKINNSDITEAKTRRSVLNFRRNEQPHLKNVHEKYIPLPQPSPVEHIYSEPRPWSTQFDDCCKPPVYQSVEKKREECNKSSGSDKKLYNSRPPCYEELAQRLSQDKNKRPTDAGLANKITQNNNKVVIYFGDSIIRKHNEQKKEEPPIYEIPRKEEAIYANRLLDETGNLGMGRDVDKGGGTQLVSEVQVPEAIYSDIKSEDAKESSEVVTINDATYKKEVFETMGADGFLIVEFEGNFERARQLVDIVHGGTGVDHHEATMLDDDEHCDWSFIQDWRKRPSSGCRVSEESAWCSGVSGARALRVRVSGAAAASSPATARRLSPPPHAHRATTPPPPLSPNNKPVPDEEPPPCQEALGGAQLKAVAAVSQLTAASSPVRAAPAQSSYALERRPKHEHQHRPLDPPQPVQNGVRECHSSSDENRSSGHASMSDSGGAGEAAREEPRRAKQPPRSKHRPHNKLQSPWPGGGGLEDIRSAIKQLTLRSRDSSSTATSGASSAGGGSNNGAPESGSVAEARRRRAPLVRQPSLDTVCTNVTSADEFVWVDSHNRLVELRCVPWTAGEVTRALQVGRCKDVAPRMAPDAPPRLAYLLQRALVRVAREAQRLSQNFGFCSKHEVAGAFRIVLSTPLADACIKGCQRAATMYATSGSAARRLGSAARARTSLAPGRFQRWMLDVRVAAFVHEYAAIYLCAGMETLLEEMALIAGSGTAAVSSAAVDLAVASCADLWGLLQPYSHLNAGRVASGALSLSRWESESSVCSGSGSSSGARPERRQLQLSHDSGITTNGSGGSGTSGTSGTSCGGAASVLLTTCAGSAGELRAVLRRAAPRHAPLSAPAEAALYYFMRCSQLEHNTAASSASCASGLWGERGAGALPPLGEWLRAAHAHAALRPPPHVPDADDIMQAARLLLPHADCPPRPVTLEEAIEPAWSRCSRSSDELTRAALGLAQKVLLSGRPELVGGVRALLPPAGIDATDAAGLTALMKASLAGDEQIVAMLLEAGADPNIETPGAAAQHSALLAPRSPASPATPPAATHTQNNVNNLYTPPTAGWTALVYACCGAGNVEAARRLLAAGARPDGAATREDVCTITPLQMACGTGNLELVQLLLSHGADPFLSTQLNDALCYSAAAQYGCYSAVGVCCSHGRRAALAAALRGGGNSRTAVLSLEEVLAEGATPASCAAPAARASYYTKQQQRALQDAMYRAAETDHLDITLELRSLGVPWSLHAWTLSLAAAADASLESVIDQLLQDFLQVCPSDDSHYSKQFIYECLPLLFNILRYSKKEGTVLLLADILCACYGWEPVPGVVEPPPAAAPAPARVDPSYVNNPSLADVTFRVEGRLFYGHKIVLVSESPRLRAMLAPQRAPSEGLPVPNTAPPLVQINDIRYHIFEQVMKYLYSGGCSNLDIPENDVLEVLAAASFFQLLPLQRHCESRAAKSVDLHNLVSVYIHAKVYGATQLLEFCQGFLLQNMVALLTYDDSVKRLLFGKRLPGHNVLGALLITLQKRIESRKNQSKSR